MANLLQHFIDGAWVDSDGGTRRNVVDPATETVIEEMVIGSSADVDRAVAAAVRAFESYGRASIEERISLLDRVIAAYQARSEDLAQALSREMGAPIALARSAQVGAGIGHFQAARRALGEFPFEERIGNGLVVHEPIGVVAMITPWNWPLNQIASKIAPALAAGCTMVLKPSEEAPGCAAILAEVLDAAGVPAGVFNLVQGDGPGVGEALSRHPDVAMVSFTGSTRAGIEVARTAAETVKRVHQELGGKAPSLLLDGADPERAVKGTLASVLLNSGQSCIAPTRLLVPAALEAEVAALAAERMRATPVGDPAQEGRQIGPLVNKRQWERVQSLIAGAMAEGAKLEAGGPGRPDGLESGYYVRPTLFSGVRNDMTIAREEIFGPVVTIIPYADEAEAVRIANDTPYGLSAVVFGDAAAVKRVAPQLRAGMVYVNGGQPDPDLPFGGYKQSGNGREYGKFGLAEFLEVKAVLGAFAD